MEGPVTADMLAARARLREKFGDGARIGGSKGGARMRRRAQPHKPVGGGDDKKLQAAIRRMGLATLPAVDEVAMIKDDGKAIAFNHPKVQAALNANTYIITGAGEEKSIEQVITTPSDIDTEMLKKFAAEWQKIQERTSAVKDDDNDDEDIPDLVEDFQAAVTKSTTEEEEEKNSGAAPES